jgi:pseudoazurin
MSRIVAAIALATALAFTGAARAAEIEVRMLNKGERGSMVFEPALIVAAPGDTIRFVPTNKGHNVETVKGMLPEGAEPFKSKFNEEYSVTLDREGVYGVKCAPHYAMGMVALIRVGKPGNIEEVRAIKQTGKAKATFEALFGEVVASN